MPQPVQIPLGFVGLHVGPAAFPCSSTQHVHLQTTQEGLQAEE